ncbi:unnamed protein product [Parascedosporium putredinis]|uniref:Uncharacterized protein n=1 Tax=Parascedosporium putredinis TaxID=1442378 RepID=A0A9P1GYT7_9PEZI|nr:unnamed protein product [Parascedosporium putredinis]CAI7990276.1 unnamed protein product [Parascedosporium putredinis]
MMGADKEVTEKESKSTTSARESFFLDFARELRIRVPNTILMVTGGFRSRVGMEAALAQNACDLIGIARPAVLKPALPKEVILNSEISDEDARVDAKRIEAPWIIKKLAPKPVGAGVESSWYSKKIQQM